MVSMAEGGWTAVGTNQEDDDPVTGIKYHWGAWILRLDENADTIWTRSLILFPEIQDTLGSRQYFHSVAELSSGSIVASGNHEDFWASPSDPVFSGILVKVDKSGCIDNLRCSSTSSTTNNSFSEQSVTVYPNPASEQVTFSFSESIKSKKQIIISDLTGRLVGKIAVSEGQHRVIWSPQKMASGLYFYQLKTAGKLLKSGKLIWSP